MATAAGSTRGHGAAILLALLVTFLWSTSWVLIKLGLEELPPLPFAGLRYALAAACLLPLLVLPRHRRQLVRLRRGDWGGLALLGLVMYTATQGAQFVALAWLPAATVGLVLSFTPVAVALAAWPLLGERPAPAQWTGTAVYLAGAALYIGPAAVGQLPAAGVVAALVGLAANATAAVLGRAVNRARRADPVVVTAVSMTIGAAVLLPGGAALQGLPSLDPGAWVIIGWLAVVNTALAFTLWNRSLQRLGAMESSVINNTMLVQIAVLAWVVVGESLTVREVGGLALAVLGVAAVQLAPWLAPRGREAGPPLEARETPAPPSA